MDTSVRGLRFSLRVAMLVVTVLCVFLAFVQTEINKKRREARAMDRINRLGFHAQPDFFHEREASWWDALIERLAPDSLRFGAGFVDVGGASREQLDIVLELLTDLPETVMLTASHTPLTDSDLLIIGGLSELMFLNVNYTQVTDKGVAHLGACKKLESLSVSGTRVTGRTLGSVRSLEKLTLHYTQVDDSGLQVISTLPKLVDLSIRSEWITAKGILHLKNSPRLQGIGVSAPRVAQEDMKRAKEEIRKALSLPNSQLGFVGRRPDIEGLMEEND